MSHTANAMGKRSIQRFAVKGFPIPHIIDAGLPDATTALYPLDAGSPSDTGFTALDAGGP